MFSVGWTIRWLFGPRVQHSSDGIHSWLTFYLGRIYIATPAIANY